MTIEDLISELVFSRISLNSWDSNLVFSLNDQINRGNSLTEKQSIIAVKIIRRHSAPLSKFLSRDIEPYIQNPTFRLPVRKITNEKRITVVDHSTHSKTLKAVFPYNDKLVESIRKNRDKIGQAVWDKEEKCWFFTLNEYSIQFLSNLDNFETDELFKNYLSQIEDIHSNIEKYVPMLIIDNSKPKLKNCDKNMPVLTSNDLISAIFEARKKGVCYWDETISNFVESDEVDTLTRSFIKTDPGEKFYVDSENYKIDRLAPIIEHLFPLMVVIPGGRELDAMTESSNFLKGIGLSNNEMSVMFRLPSDTQATFNEFVKFNELNSPISENTKVVFVSGKIPKPIFKSGIKFNGVLNLGYNNVHYTMRDFIKTHENTIIYSKGKDMKNIKYDFM